MDDAIAMVSAGDVVLPFSEHMRRVRMKQAIAELQAKTPAPQQLVAQASSSVTISRDAQVLLALEEVELGWKTIS